MRHRTLSIILALPKVGARLIRIFAALVALGAAQIAAGNTDEGPVESRSSMPATRAKEQQPVVSLFSTDDYPADALRRQEQGTTAVKLKIDTNGSVAKCDVVATSGSASLDRATCTIFETRGRFTPARDAENRAVGDETVLRVRWMLPDEPIEEKHLRVIFALDAARQGEGCKIESSNNAKFDCAALIPIRDQFLSLQDHPRADELVVETGMKLGKGHDLSSIGDGTGQLPLSLMGYTLVIDPDGRPIECQPAVQGLRAEAVRTMCDGAMLQHYKPLPEDSKDKAPRLVTNYQAIYLSGASKPPKLTNLGLLFSPDNYPSDALAAGQEGTTAVKVTIEADGRPTRCEIISSAGTSSLDSESCKNIMARGEFAPGLDPQGRPQRAELVQRIRWELPQSPLRDTYTRVRFQLGPNGSTSSCSIEGDNDEDLTCDDAKSAAQFAIKSPEAAAKRTMVIEAGGMLGSGESVEHFGQARGQTLWHLSAVTLEIDANGKVIGCNPTFDWMKDEQTDEDCESVKSDKFVALAATDTRRSSRYFTRYFLIYFEN